MLSTGLLELETVGRVVTPIRVENLKDLWYTERGSLPAEQVRRIDVMDALVDTGSILLALPTRFIQQLGLTKVRERTVVTTRGVATAAIFDAVQLTIMDRQCVVEVIGGSRRYVRFGWPDSIRSPRSRG